MRKTNQPSFDYAEDRAALFFGGQRVRGSGQGFRKSDVTQGLHEGYRVEVKSTTQETMSLQTSWFGKISRESRAESQTPALFLQFKNLEAFALTPDELPEGENPMVLNGSSTRITPESLRKTGYIQVPEKVFEDAGCGKAWIFPIWRVEEVTD